LRFENEDVCYDGDFRIDSLIVIVSYQVSLRGKSILTHANQIR